MKVFGCLVGFFTWATVTSVEEINFSAARSFFGAFSIVLRKRFVKPTCNDGFQVALGIDCTRAMRLDVFFGWFVRLHLQTTRHTTTCRRILIK